MPSPKVISPQTQDKYSLDKETVGGTLLLTLHGTVDHAFEGKKVGAAVTARKVVVDMRDARRFASWGMSEWMDFLRINVNRDLYLVECSTYSVSQLNLVTGLLGHAKLVSFYASYRCGSCSKELESLFLVPQERAHIRDLPESSQVCASCGGRARLEEYPAAFFDAIASRPAFDIDDEVVALLHTRYGYDIAVDTSRFRAHRRVQKDYTYLRLSGDVTALPSAPLVAASTGTTVLDLEHLAFDPYELTSWRAYMQGARATAKSLQLAACPVGFLEAGVFPEDLHDKVKVRTFALGYHCGRCATDTVQMVDVATHLEELAGGAVPAARCPKCQDSLAPQLTPGLQARIRALPARDRDPALDSFLAKASQEQRANLDDALAPRAPVPAVVPGARSTSTYVLGAVGVAALCAMAVVAVLLLRKRDQPLPTLVAPTVPVVASVAPKPAFERPDWVQFDVPSSAYCQDLINRMVCVGVSSYSKRRDDAVAEASAVALEELVNAIGLKIADPQLRNSVTTAPGAIRTKLLADLTTADVDRESTAYHAADAALAAGRKRVVESFRVSGGPAVPAQRSDWHWEEYDAKSGGTEFLVFVRYDITLDAVKSLVDRYSTPTTVLGSSVITAFPAAAWEHSDFAGGVLVRTAGRPLADAKVAAGNLITAVGDTRVADTTSLARQLQDWKAATGPLRLEIKAGETPARVAEIPRNRVR